MYYFPIVREIALLTYRQYVAFCIGDREGLAIGGPSSSCQRHAFCLACCLRVIAAPHTIGTARCHLRAILKAVKLSRLFSCMNCLGPCSTRARAGNFPVGSSNQRDSFSSCERSPCCLAAPLTVQYTRVYTVWQESSNASASVEALTGILNVTGFNTRVWLKVHCAPLCSSKSCTGRSRNPQKLKWICTSFLAFCLLLFGCYRYPAWDGIHIDLNASELCGRDAFVGKDGLARFSATADASENGNF